MKCPRDQAVLTFTEEGAYLRDRCPKCEGVLLGADEVAATLGRGREGAAAIAAERIAQLPEAAVACPRDGLRMRTLVHKGVELDVCAECHSLWMDPGEVEKISARGKRGRKGKALAAGAAAAALGGAAVAIASQADKPGMLAQAADLAGDVVVEGAIDVAFEFVGDAIGSLLDGLF